MDFLLEDHFGHVHREAMVPYLFCEEEMHLCASGALWWQAEGALLVSDLHLGKARFFARTGQFLPPYDSSETLSRLHRIIGQTQPRQVICLGDSFHDADGARHMEPHALTILQECARGRRWLWVTGNHDHSAAPPLGDIAEALVIRNIHMRHEALPSDDQPEISGHFHPVLRLRHRGQSVRRRCYVASDSKFIMPAFGALTGGLDARDPAFDAAIGKGRIALVASADRLMRFPCSASGKWRLQDTQTLRQQ